MNSHANTRLKCLVVAGIILILVAFVWTGSGLRWHNLGFALHDWFYPDKGGATKQEIEQTLEDAQIARGQSKESIHAWLRGRGWGFAVHGKPGDETLPGLGSDRSDVESYTCGGVSGKTTSVSYSDITVCFYFDKDERLMFYAVKEKIVMP